MSISTIIWITWAGGALVLFVVMMLVKTLRVRLQKEDSWWRTAMYCLVIAALWPLMLPTIIFRPAGFVRVLRQQLQENQCPAPSESEEEPDEEPDPLLMAEELPDWTDGTEEYEDD